MDNHRGIYDDQWIRCVHCHEKVGGKIVQRFTVKEEEKQKILTTYFKDGLLETFPRKEKRKVVILEAIVQYFDKDEIYSEREVNEKLKMIYPDFATIRRYLIDYGMLERNKDGTAYWVKDRVERS